MQTISLIWGVLAALGMIVAFTPCLGALNWLVIPFAAIGLIFSIVTLATAPAIQRKTPSIAGIVLCGIAVVFGFIRLLMGGGIL